MNRKKLIITFVIFGILFGNAVVSQNVRFNPIKPGQKLTTTISDEQQAILAVRKAKASVVNITGFKKIPALGRGPLMLEPFILEPINGSGFVYSADGLIISNSHVVQEDNAEYIVVFANRQEYTAKVLGLDRFNDVAVLKIEARGLTAASLGDSDELETGQSVFAIGNSLGRYQNTVTRGVVSGLGRILNLSTVEDVKPRQQNLIQTDAAINPGNSGGPLVNMLGEVIGVNVAVDRTGEAVGFAVPINIVKNSVHQLLTFGKVSRPYLGISFTTIDKIVQSRQGTALGQGALIESIVKGGPADLAGLKPKDIVLEINREKLTLVNELDRILQKYRAGDTVLFKYWREGKAFETPVLLAEFR